MGPVTTALPSAPRRRLAAQDSLWLDMDRPNNLMVVDSLAWTASPVDWDRFRSIARARLWDRYPVFRSRVVTGADGAWYWEEREGCDFDDQFAHVVLPTPGGVAELQRFLASQRTVALDRSRPLWRIYCVDGFNGGSALFTRTHHAIADGIRMVQLAMSLFDAAPDGGAVIGPAVRLHAERREHGATSEDRQRLEAIDQLPSIGALALDTVASWIDLVAVGTVNPLAGVRGAASNVAAIVESLETRLRSTIPAARGLTNVLSVIAADVDFVRKLALGTRNDMASWTGPVGSHKAVGWAEPISLAEVKNVARAHNVTVNDVLVACVAGTLHTYLSAHGCACASVNWMIPVNLKPLAPTLPEELGNSFAIVQLEMPTDVADPVATLAIVHQRMTRIKKGHEAGTAFLVQALLSGVNRTVYRSAVDVLAGRAVGVLTNVPGPPAPVYLAGEKVEGMVGWAPLSGDQAMSFTIYSYDNKVFVGIACDAGLVPDHIDLVDGFADAFNRLATAA